MPLDDLRSPPGWRARLALAFERRGARSVLASREHDGPLVVQKALYPEGEGICHAIVVHPPAGIAGGDELTLEIAARGRAHALITTPGAGKWYRSAGPWASQRVSITAQPGAALEWLPQETIVFDGALADIGFEASIAADARLIAWEIACLGRTGAGEGFDSGRLRMEMRVRRAGRLAWLERARLDPGTRVRGAQPGLAGRPVFGTLLAAAPAIDDTCLAACRAHTARRGEGAVTRLPGLLVARYRGDCTEAARRYFEALWGSLREPLLGVPAVTPRIWRT